MEGGKRQRIRVPARAYPPQTPTDYIIKQITLEYHLLTCYISPPINKVLCCDTATQTKWEFGENPELYPQL